MGRPSTYDSSFCERVLGWGEEGKSITWMAAQLDISRETIYAWTKTFPEFSDAITRAKAKAQARWEDMGEGGLYQREFQGSVWLKSMAARFPDDWREKSETALTNANGGPVEIITRRVVDPKA